MSKHYLYRDGNAFKIRGSMNKDIFYVHTSGVIIGIPTGVPGMVQGFNYYGEVNDQYCSEYPEGQSIYFTWTSPSEDEGGNTITGYAIRRIGLKWVGDDDTQYPIGFTSAYSGDPNYVYSTLYGYNEDFIEVYYGSVDCEGDDETLNAITVGNVNSTTISGWNCGFYSFQIAATNASGTGNWYPTAQDFADPDFNDFLTFGEKPYTSVGRRHISIEISGGLISISYSDFSGSGNCGPPNEFGGVSGYITEFGSNDKILEGISSTRGQISFSAGGLQGWYRANVLEYFSSYSDSCPGPFVHGCLNTPFYID
jgi:hypothetical protein